MDIFEDTVAVRNLIYPSLHSSGTERGDGGREYHCAYGVAGVAAPDADS